MFKDSYLHDKQSIKKKATHGVLMKNCSVVSCKIQFGESFLQNVQNRL